MKMELKLKIKSLTLAAIFMVSAGAMAGWFSEEITGDRDYPLGEYLWIDSLKYYDEHNLVYKKEHEMDAWKGERSFTNLIVIKNRPHRISDEIGIRTLPKSDKIVFTGREHQYKKAVTCSFHMEKNKLILKRRYPKLYKKAYSHTYNNLRKAKAAKSKYVSKFVLGDGNNSLTLECNIKNRLILVYKVNNFIELAKSEIKELEERLF